MDSDAFPSQFFDRADESPDSNFYRQARLVTHIDDATIAALREAYRELIPPGARVLDLMSSWISHLPEVEYASVDGLGMNPEELQANPRLDRWCVHDLNVAPELPYEDDSFDAVLNAVSIQYLAHPVEVFASIDRTLAPGGVSIVATSHRLFPTKAIRAWHILRPVERVRVIARYFELAGGYGDAVCLDRSPPNADPLWLVHARTRNGRPG